LKVNQFLKVEPPPDDYLMKLQKQLTSFQKILDSGDLSINKSVENEEITLITKALHETNIEEPIERGVAALIAFHGHNAPEPVEDLIEEEVEGALTIFSALRVTANSQPILVADKVTFAESLLPINETRNQMMTIERLAGAKDKYAGTVANELIKDFQMATSYPPEERDAIDPQNLTDIVRALSTKIATEREKAIKKSQEELT